MKINGKPDGGGGSGVITGLSVTENGIYMPSAGVDGFAPVDVDVQPSLQDKTVSVNGSYTADQGYYGLSTVTVNVPDIPAVTESLTVSVNNTYYPGQGVDGFSQVVVDVPQSVTGFTEKNITEGNYGIVNLNNSASYVALYNFYTNSTIQTVNLSNCQNVQTYGFNSCKNLTTVSLPECTTIEVNAFQSCSNLTEVYIPKCISIPNYAFGSCYKLSIVTLSSVIDTIGPNAFTYCSGLTELNLGICKSMNNQAFRECRTLSRFSVDGWNEASTNVFNNCTNLEELTLNLNTYCITPYTTNILANTKIINGTGSIYVNNETYSKWITTTGWSSLAARFVSVEVSTPILSYSDNKVFGNTRIIYSNCISYLGITVNDVSYLELPGCEYLYGSAFTNYNKLIEVSLGSNCKSVYHDAFRQCTSLMKVTIPTSYVCNGDWNMFTNTPIAGTGAGSIYVPASLVDAYKSAQYWSAYSTHIFPIE